MARKILSTMCMIILVSLLTGSWNVASGDPVINYQGRLTDPNGNPINGVYKIVFKVYEQETGGSALWMENYNAVPVSNGFFSVKLGSITSLTSVDFSKDLWLGITVESDSEMNPRLKLEDVPQALGSKDNFVVVGDVKGSRLCIGSDCRTNWPSGGSSQWITSGSSIYYNAGNVGIGTASPEVGLHVGGIIRTDYGLTVGHTGGWSPIKLMTGSNLYWDLFSAHGGFGAENLELQYNGLRRVSFTDYGSTAFGGRVNIGGFGDPGTEWTLRVEGDALASDWRVYSDSRFKKNVAHIDNALDTVLKLNGVSYEWNTEEHKDKNFSEGKHYGVIGQETEKVLPEIVKEDGNGYETIAYTELIPILIESIKEQQKIIEELKAKVQKLESKDFTAKTQ